MIAKFVVALAVCAQVFATPCCGAATGSSSVVVQSTETKAVQTTPVAVVATSSSSSSSSSSEPTTINRNLVGKGKYPVALRNCGPTPDQQIPVTTSRFTAPAQEKPTVRLPATIPGPKVISHSCTCYKTIVRPRVHQHIITVPTVHRYIETTHKPVIENIQYEAYPVNCDNSASGKVQFVEVPAETTPATTQVQIPVEQTVEVPRVQVVEAPRVQVVEAPRVQTVEVQRVEVPRVQTVEVQRVEVPRVQTVEVPQVQTVEVPQVQTVEVPRVQTVEVQRAQAVEIPQSFSESHFQF